MAMENVRTVTGSRPATGITDADFDAYKAIEIDNARAGGNAYEVAYTLTGTTANEDNVYGILGNKDSNISATTGARDTLITGGIVPMQFSTTYVAATHKGLGVVTSTTAGVVNHVTAGGKGRIVDGGTLTIKGTSRNVVWVDLDAR